MSAICTAADIEFVRLLLGDTDEAAPLLTDRQITLLLGESEGNRYAAAALGADTLSAKFAGATDATLGDVSVSNSQLSTQYSALAVRLRRQALIRTTAPYAGGISKSDKERQEDNANRVEPSFTKALHKATGLRGNLGDHPE